MRRETQSVGDRTFARPVLFQAELDPRVLFLGGFPLGDFIRKLYRGPELPTPIVCEYAKNIIALNRKPQLPGTGNFNGASTEKRRCQAGYSVRNVLDDMAGPQTLPARITQGQFVVAGVLVPAIALQAAQEPPLPRRLPRPHATNSRQVVVFPVIGRNSSPGRSCVSRLRLPSFRRNAGSLTYVRQCFLTGYGKRRCIPFSAPPHTDSLPLVCGHAAIRTSSGHGELVN